MLLKKIFFIFFSFFYFSVAYGDDIFLSLKKNKVNVRYGPSFNSPVKYIYKMKNLPIKQIDKKENFRRIIDFKNNGGWIHVSQLQKVNSVISYDDKILFAKPSNFSKPLVKVKRGRVLLINKCEENWCKVKTKNIKGWINSNNLWGN